MDINIININGNRDLGRNRQIYAENGKENEVVDRVLKLNLFIYYVIYFEINRLKYNNKCNITLVMRQMNILYDKLLFYFLIVIVFS